MIDPLKGTVPRDFLLQVFFINHLPQAPVNNIRIISNFFENSGRYSQVKVHHRVYLALGKLIHEKNQTSKKSQGTVPLRNHVKLITLVLHERLGMLETFLLLGRPKKFKKCN
jgi:hypothetical protein